MAAPAGAETPPSARIERLPAGVARPVLDGRLDDPAWNHAGLLGPLTQVVPVEGAAPSQATEVRLLYDADTLYIAVRAFDSEPEKLIASGMRRDATLTQDDRITLLLDTFHDHRNSFLFSTNPNGARLDGLIENNTSFRAEWDAIWNVRTRVDAEGWSAEFEIPFKSLSFDPSSNTWGFNLLRAVRRHTEENRWASAKQNKSLIDMSEAGDLVGFEGLQQGLGLDFIPSGALRWGHERNGGGSTTAIDPSFDAFYKITPSVTAALTANTDFSDADVDARQVNLDRFALFFPETRAFFLQDGGIFDFGGLSENGLPFFSRRIGISDNGEIVDIRGGAKVTGRVGPLNFGVLDVQMAGFRDENGRDVDGKNLSVARAKWNLGRESSLGLIATHGDPRGNGSSSLLGADMRLRSSQVFGDQILQLDAWGQQSSTSGVSGDDGAYGVLLSYPNDRWNASLGASRIETNFDPALGFVNRTGIHAFTGSVRRRWRPVASELRTIDLNSSGRVVTSTGGRLETIDFQPNVELRNHANDYVALRGQVRTERFMAPFEIVPGVTILPGRYDWTRMGVGFGTSNARPFSAGAEFSVGSFFSGHLRALNAFGEWRPSKHFIARLEYLQNDGRLSEGSFTTRLGRLRLNVVFSPDLSWDTFVQYDNISDGLSWNSRIRWILSPGEEIVLVWNQAFETGDHVLRGVATELTGKVSWTFRF